MPAATVIQSDSEADGGIHWQQRAESRVQQRSAEHGRLDGRGRGGADVQMLSRGSCLVVWLSARLLYAFPLASSDRATHCTAAARALRTRGDSLSLSLPLPPSRPIRAGPPSATSNRGNHRYLQAERPAEEIREARQSLLIRSSATSSTMSDRSRGHHPSGVPPRTGSVCRNTNLVYQYVGPSAGSIQQ